MNPPSCLNDALKESGISLPSEMAGWAAEQGVVTLRQLLDLVAWWRSHPVEGGPPVTLGDEALADLHDRLVECLVAGDDEEDVFPAGIARPGGVLPPEEMEHPGEVVGWCSLEELIDEGIALDSDGCAHEKRFDATRTEPEREGDSNVEHSSSIERED